MENPFDTYIVALRLIMLAQSLLTRMPAAHRVSWISSVNVYATMAMYSVCRDLSVV